MLQFDTLQDVRLERPTYLTIGVFDGLHLGHQRLIGGLVEAAHAADHLAAVMTFFPHPDVVLRGTEATGRYYLTTHEERAALMRALGVDVLVTHPFDRVVMQVRAQTFIDQLSVSLRPSALWVGPDFALGHKREGNIAFLRQHAAFEVHEHELVRDGGQTISSTRVRELLGTGDVMGAAALLGRLYAVHGEVAHGDQRGRTIGFPTANLRVWEQKLIPANGVYAGWAYIDGQRHMAVTNVGTRPTFDSGQTATIEVHLLDFAREIYGHTLLFEFAQRLRAEMRFDGVEALVQQIRTDADIGRAYLSSLGSA